MLEQTGENSITPATNLPFLEHQRRMFMLLVTKWERWVISRSKNKKLFWLKNLIALQVNSYFLRSFSFKKVWGDKIDIMTVIPRQTKTYTCCVNYCFTSTPEVHARAVIDQLGYEKMTYGPLIHDLEFQLRYPICL